MFLLPTALSAAVISSCAATLCDGCKTVTIQSNEQEEEMMTLELLTWHNGVVVLLITNSCKIWPSEGAAFLPQTRIHFLLFKKRLHRHSYKDTLN